MISIVTQEGLLASQEAAGDEQINQLERALVQAFPPVDCQVRHSFTPGLYSRSIYMPKGTVITSKIHRCEHPYVVTQGSAMVRVNGEWTAIIAPYHGITKAGTRRVLVITEDCVWTTYHVTQKTSVESVEAEIIEPHTHDISILEDNQ